VIRDAGMEFRAVFVSTVRSRHRISKLADNVAVGVGEFGFLSESHLVNTALSRAKSWLAVIGDPVALCSIGNCGVLWRSYLKHCQKVGSVHPAELSLDDIWQHSQGLMQLLSVNSSLNAADATPPQQPLSQVSPYISTADTSSSVTQSQQPASQLSTFEVSYDEFEWQSTDNMLQQIDDSATNGTGTQAVYVSGAKAHARHVTAEDSSSSEEEKSDDDRHGVRIRDMTHGVKTTQQLSSDNDDDDDDDDDDTDADVASDADDVSCCEWSLANQLEADEIIRQLAQVCYSTSVSVSLSMFTATFSTQVYYKGLPEG